MKLLPRLLLAAAVAVLVAGVAWRTRPDPSPQAISAPYGRGTLQHTAPRRVADGVPPLALAYRGPEEEMFLLTVTLLWSTSTEGAFPESPLPLQKVAGGCEFRIPEVPLDPGTALRYSFRVRGPAGDLELPGPGQKLVVHAVGTDEAARIRLHAGGLLVGVFLAVLGGLEALAALRSGRFERALTWLSLATAGVLAMAALLSVSLVVTRGLAVSTLTRIVALAALWAFGAALSLLASARERYLRPCALACLLAAALTVALALLPHGFAA